jgi:hypothetical protein
MENLPSSTQNRTYHETIQWLVAQLKTAAQEVLPGESCQTNEAFTWKARFGEHCNKYSAEAYQIYCKFEIIFHVVPKPEILAKYMFNMGFDDKDVTTSDDIELCIRK